MKMKVVTSANFVQRFEAAWTPEQHSSHIEAGRRVDKITRAASTGPRSLYAIVWLHRIRSSTWMLEQFRENGLIADSAPNVSVGPHSGDPHYEPTQSSAAPVREGDLMLLDVWAKLDQPDSVYYDITWMGYLGKKVPKKYAPNFRSGQTRPRRGVSFVTESVRAGRELKDGKWIAFAGM